MGVAHVGVAVCAFGVILSTFLQVQQEIRISPGENTVLQGYQFDFLGMQETAGKNYQALTANFIVHYAGQNIAVLTPEKRRYVSSSNVMSLEEIKTNVFRDLYVVLGEPLSDDSWSMRIYVKPFVRFIWLGGILMMLGGLIALWQRVRQ